MLSQLNGNYCHQQEVLEEFQISCLKIKVGSIANSFSLTQEKSLFLIIFHPKLLTDLELKTPLSMEKLPGQNGASFQLK